MFRNINARFILVFLVAIFHFSSANSQNLLEKSDACIDPTTNENRCAVPEPEKSKVIPPKNRSNNRKNIKHKDYPSISLSVDFSSVSFLQAGKQKFSLLVDSYDVKELKYCNITVRSIFDGESRSFLFNIGSSNRVKIGYLDEIFTLKLIGGGYGCLFEVDTYP